VLFISFFFLKDSRLMQTGLMTFVPDSKEGKLVNSIEKINNMLSRYFAGLLLQLLILFAIYTIVLLIFGVENAIVIAFLCALFNIIPYVGPLIGGVIMITLTMTIFLVTDFSTVILPKALCFDRNSRRTDDRQLRFTAADLFLQCEITSLGNLSGDHHRGTALWGGGHGGRSPRIHGHKGDFKGVFDRFRHREK